MDKKIIDTFWSVKEKIKLSPIEISLFFFLFSNSEFNDSVEKTDTLLINVLSISEGQLRYAKNNLSKLGLINVVSGLGRSNASLYSLGDSFNSETAFVLEQEKAQTEVVTQPLSVDKEETQVVETLLHAPEPQTQVIERVEKVVKEQQKPFLHQDSIKKVANVPKANSKKRYTSKVFLTEGEILSIKDFIDKFNRELGSYYGNVLYEKTSTFSRQNVLKIISMYNRQTIHSVFDMIKNSDFLLNKAKPYSWTCTFDWIVMPNHFGKIFAGAYANYQQKSDDNSQPHTYSNELSRTNSVPSNKRNFMFIDEADDADFYAKLDEIADKYNKPKEKVRNYAENLYGYLSVDNIKKNRSGKSKDGFQLDDSSSCPNFWSEKKNLLYNINISAVQGWIE